jgi:hypothetical protein
MARRVFEGRINGESDPINSTAITVAPATMPVAAVAIRRRRKCVARR